jgi:hypothetical protein
MQLWQPDYLQNGKAIKKFEHRVYFSRSAYKRSNLHFQIIHAT